MTKRLKWLEQQGAKANAEKLGLRPEHFAKDPKQDSGNRFGDVLDSKPLPQEPLNDAGIVTRYQEAAIRAHFGIETTGTKVTAEQDLPGGRRFWKIEEPGNGEKWYGVGADGMKKIQDTEQKLKKLYAMDGQTGNAVTVDMAGPELSPLDKAEKKYNFWKWADRIAPRVNRGFIGIGDKFDALVAKFLHAAAGGNDSEDKVDPTEATTKHFRKDAKIKRNIERQRVALEKKHAKGEQLSFKQKVDIGLAGDAKSKKGNTVLFEFPKGTRIDKGKNGDGHLVMKRFGDNDSAAKIDIDEGKKGLIPLRNKDGETWFTVADESGDNFTLQIGQDKESGDRVVKLFGGKDQQELYNQTLQDGANNTADLKEQNTGTDLGKITTSSDANGDTKIELEFGKNKIEIDVEGKGTDNKVTYKDDEITLDVENASESEKTKYKLEQMVKGTIGAYRERSGDVPETVDGGINSLQEMLLRKEIAAY